MPCAAAAAIARCRTIMKDPPCSSGNWRAWHCRLTSLRHPGEQLRDSGSHFTASRKNLRWRDIMPAKDREGREIVVLFVQGKGKSRQLVAPKSVGDDLERIRAISKATKQDSRVFATVTGDRKSTRLNSRQ